MSGETYAISDLVEKRIQLSGQIKFHRDQIKSVKADLAAIDSALKIFGPDFDIY